MDIVYYIDEPSGKAMVVIDVGVCTPSEVAADYVWVCRVCCNQTRGQFDREQTSAYLVFRSPLGALCCALEEVEIAYWGVERGYSAGERGPDSGLYFQVRWARHAGLFGEGRYILEGVVKSGPA